MSQNSKPTNKDEKQEDDKKKPSQNLTITEWRFSELLGEKIPISNFKSNPENESFIVTKCDFSSNGDYQVVCDKGGRVIIFKKKEKKNMKRLEYYYEYSGHERDFDVHKSQEYSEEVRGMSILPVSETDSIDILTASYRNININKVYQRGISIYDTTEQNEENSLFPKLKAVKNEVKHKSLHKISGVHCNEINSLSVNSQYPEVFISSDEYNVLLWDMNHIKEVYNIITLNNDDSERITTSTYSPYNSSIFAYGTSKGSIFVKDVRESSNINNTKSGIVFKDENSNLQKTIFSNQLLSIHDIKFNMKNEYLLVNRTYLSVNLWDERKTNEPLFKYMLYEPIINKLSFLYQNNFFNDKFNLSTDLNGKFIVTGGYNNIFHVLDVEQRLNSQILIDDTNEKVSNLNVIRKVNSKGSCFYKKDDPDMSLFDFNKKILSVAISPKESLCMLASFNCIYTYLGSLNKGK